MKLPNPDFIATTSNGETFNALWIDTDVIDLSEKEGAICTVVCLYDSKTVKRLINEAVENTKKER